VKPLLGLTKVQLYGNGIKWIAQFPTSNFPLSAMFIKDRPTYVLAADDVVDDDEDGDLLLSEIVKLSCIRRSGVTVIGWLLSVDNDVDISADDKAADGGWCPGLIM